MPEITDAELRQFTRYQSFGTPDEIQKKINDLEKDNHSQRDKLRAHEEKLPKDGQIVVAQSDADELAKFRELGKPEELKTVIETGGKAVKELADLKQHGAAADFVKAAGLADETVATLVAIPDLKDATFEVRKVKVKDDKGQEVEKDVAYVKLAGENQKAMTFEDAQKQVPALKGLRLATPTEEKPGQNFVPQGGGENKSKPGTVYDKIRKDREEAKKPQEVKPGSSVEDRLGMGAGAH